MNKKFTILFSSFIFLLLIDQNSNLIAQTWINSFEYENTFGNGHLNNDTFNVGPLEMVRSVDGNIIMLSEVDQTKKGEVIKIDTSGNLIWIKPAYQSGGVYREYVSSLYPTSDSGCVYLFTHDGTPVYFEVRRLNKNGSNKWIKQYTLPQGVIDIDQTNNNTTLIQFKDSLIELNEFGSYIRSRVASNSTFVRYKAIGDSDIIVTDTNNVRRENFSGNSILWSYPGAYTTVNADTSIIYLRKNGTDTLIKLQPSTGNVVWEIAHSFHYASVTSDFGLITSRYKTLSRLDSSGNLVWQRTIDFPVIRFTNVIEGNPNQYITGGQYRCINANYVIFNVGYSAFYASLDSSGHGIIDSTDHFFMGNANDNGVGGFLDDAAYIAVASGTTGPPRIPLLQLPNPVGACTVFAKDWSQSFFNGVNYKFSDVDGNGIIDLTDIAIMNSYWPFPYSVYSHWRISAPFVTAPGLKLDIINDSLAPGDTATMNIILGSNTVGIDSIYALAISINAINIISDSIDVNLTAMQFGDPSVNLYKYFSSSGGLINLLIARNDHQNAFVAGDTIARIKFTENSSSTPGLKTINFQATALTALGYPVTLSLISDSIYFSGTNTIFELPSSNIKLYPNPTSEYINIDVGNDKIKNLKMFDNMGKVLKSETDLKYGRLNVYDLACGVYPLEIITEKGKWNSIVFINR
jgi:hypothetical protein